MHRYHLLRSGGFSPQEECEHFKGQSVSDAPMVSGLCGILYDGILTVTDPDRFRDAQQTGVGHGKAMGLGLLSVAPIA